MRIKRFTAPDMRTALRMIRDEQGPDAVILSNRAVAGGIEVVSATDYDEALVSQALRAASGQEANVPAAPMQDAAAQSPSPTAMQAAHAATVAGAAGSSGAAASFAAFLSSHSQAAAAPAPAHADAVPESVAAAMAVVGQPRKPAAKVEATPARESLISRARAVFRIGDDEAPAPTLAELAAQSPMPVRAPAQPAPLPQAQPPMAATIEPAQPASRIEPVEPKPIEPALGGSGHGRDRSQEDASRPWPLPQESLETAKSAPSAEPVAPMHATPAQVAQAAEPPRHLHAVPDAQQPDPAIVAMREEMARMRQMMESQMEQLSLERLRGSPGRAAAIDALLGFGCEDTLAQAVAAKLDPRLAPEEIHAPMRAELARMLTVARSEPIEEGGVIALVGPTGAGKTTTAAKLAARFAARHRARDVALVTTDLDRAGAREQLHTLGRRLGITVCEAAGPEGLQSALAQLVDYPLVLVDTAGHAPRDRALFGQILWLRASRAIRSLLVLPANAHPHDLGEVIRRYRPAAPEGVVLTKLDETGRLGSALSVAVRHGLNLAYTTGGQQVPSDLDAADAQRLVHALEQSTRAADNPFAIEDRHAV